MEMRAIDRPSFSFCSWSLKMILNQPGDTQLKAWPQLSRTLCLRKHLHRDSSSANVFYSDTTQTPKHHTEIRLHLTDFKSWMQKSVLKVLTLLKSAQMKKPALLCRKGMSSFFSSSVMKLWASLSLCLFSGRNSLFSQSVSKKRNRKTNPSVKCCCERIILVNESI